MPCIWMENDRTPATGASVPITKAGPVAVLGLIAVTGAEPPPQPTARAAVMARVIEEQSDILTWFFTDMAFHFLSEIQTQRQMRDCFRATVVNKRSSPCNRDPCPDAPTRFIAECESVQSDPLIRMQRLLLRYSAGPENHRNSRISGRHTANCH